jgi:hypothetical protein
VSHLYGIELLAQGFGLDKYSSFLIRVWTALLSPKKLISDLRERKKGKGVEGHLLFWQN